MPSPLTNAHIEAQSRLRGAASEAVWRIWQTLPGHNRENVDEWLSKVVPVVLAAQRQSVSLTEAFLARSLERQPIGIDPSTVIGAAVRNGTPPETVYERPFVTVWSALGSGTAFPDALSSGLSRATSTAAMDVQLSMRATANAVQEADPNLYGFTRAADPGACAFCAEIDGAYVKSADAMPLHNHCGCGLEPLTSPHPRAASLPSGVAVHKHGELGPVLTDPAHDFTTASQALA
jgi:hypothetical protein